jgi:hypothetical protein
MLRFGLSYCPCPQAYPLLAHKNCGKPPASFICSDHCATRPRPISIKAGQSAFGFPFLLQDDHIRNGTVGPTPLRLMGFDRLPLLPPPPVQEDLNVLVPRKLPRQIVVEVCMVSRHDEQVTSQGPSRLCFRWLDSRADVERLGTHYAVPCQTVKAVLTSAEGGPDARSAYGAAVRHAVLDTSLPGG